MDIQALTGNGSEVHFAKVVANPTPLSWSQIYNAGSLFAVLSLEYKEVSGTDIPVLSMVGKEIFNSLEEEYFTLEEKNFISVKEAIAKALEKVPPQLSASFLVATIPPGKDTILYVYVIGNGTILLKRGEQVGQLLKGTDELQSASGILEDKDLLVLQTDEFAQKIPQDALVSSLNLPPGDVAEVFGATIHQGSGGKEAALILSYHKKVLQEEFVLPVMSDVPQIPNIEETPEVFSQEFSTQPKASPLSFIAPFMKTVTQKITSLLPSRTPDLALQLNHKKKIYLTIAVILTAALLVSGFLAFRKQQDARLQAEVEKVLSEATQKYTEGEVLAGLNKNLAREDFEQAKDILENNKSKFPSGSTQRQEVDALLVKVQNALSPLSDTIKITPTEVSLDQSPLLNLSKTKNAQFVTKTDSALYYLHSEGVFSASVNGQNPKSLIKSSEWEKTAGLGVFGSNIYVVDTTENQIYKFIPTGASFAKSNYLTSDTDISDTRSITIDGSIWVLLKNGDVKKFTRGKEDSFVIAGLPSPFSNPSRIFTTAESNNLYILDNGNSRIVIVSKNGTYSSQLQADVLKTAKDFEVVEKEKKIYVLSTDKLWVLTLN